MIERRLTLNGIFWNITSLCMQILNRINSITISGTFKLRLLFMLFVDTSVASASSVVEPDWSRFRCVLCIAISH